MNALFVLMFIILDITDYARGKSVIIPTNLTDIQCSDKLIINIENIYLERAYTECGKMKQCDLTEDDKDKIKLNCNDKHSCKIGDFGQDCFNGNVYYSFSYACTALYMCDFEDHQCDWQTHSTDQIFINWIRHKGPSYSEYSGPHTDHTHGNASGYYMYLNGGTSIYEHIAHMRSPPFSSNSNTCFIFWYNMYHGFYERTEMGGLFLFLDDKQIWNATSNYNSSWIRVAIDLEHQDRHFHITFEARNLTSDAAVDDITLEIGSCSGFKRHNEICIDTASVSRFICPKNYTIIEEFDLSFDSEIQGCTAEYQNAEDIIKSTCNALNVTQSCEINFNDIIETQPQCFRRNKLQIEYSCSGITHQSSKSHETTGIITVVTVGVTIIIFLIVLVLVILRRRKFAKKNDDKEGHITRQQHISLSAVTQQLQINEQYIEPRDHCLSSDIRTLTKASFSSTKWKTSNQITNEYNSGTDISGSNEYDFVDPRSENEMNKFIKVATVAPSEYAILDSNETGFNRSKYNNERNTEYNVALSVNPDTCESIAQNTYSLTNDATYDTSENVRHKEINANLYSHIVGSVYDTASHERPNEDKEDTYDHFFQ